MRRMLIAGNWKMHGTYAGVADLIGGIKQGLIINEHTDVAVCPPFVYLHEAARLLAGSSIALGAQNLCAETGPGAYTGEVSAVMLRDVKCSYVIVGHSERRTLYGETNEIATQKALIACRAGLTPILCVGEHLADRERNDTETVIGKQLDAVLKQKDAATLINNIVIAYEPVWAIGTGLTATPAQAEQVHVFIRQRVARYDTEAATRLRIIYGGSVKPGNAAELFAIPDIDGGLIGGASLEPDQFLAICHAGH